jgi:uncharacterized membrane protein
MAGAIQVMRARQSVPFSFSLRWSWWAVVPLALAITACAVPWLLWHSPELGLALQRGFALVCHQRPERSFLLFGGSVAVCARCLGIYIGAAMGLTVRVSRRVAWRWLMAAFAVNAMDWFAEIAGIHGNWTGTRFVMGIALGMAGAMLVAATIEPARLLATELNGRDGQI